MKPGQETQLEKLIQRELKTLPELPAPATVADQVMAAIARRAQIPWYHRSWAEWPGALQAMSLVVMLVLFAGLCLAGAHVPQTRLAGDAAHQANRWFAGLDVIGNTLKVLADSAGLAFHQLGSGLLVAVAVAAGVGYALCLGLGTLYCRTVFLKR